MKRNVEYNDVGGNVHVAELNWGEEIKDVPGDIDLVLAADCVYFEVSLPLVLLRLWGVILHSACIPIACANAV
jgi:hypothetical protein